MRCRRLATLVVLYRPLTFTAVGQEKGPKYLDPIDVNVPHVSTDKSVKYDYDIVYVRAQRAGDKVHKRFYTDFSQPVTMEPGADLMLLHPDGRRNCSSRAATGPSPTRSSRSTASGSTTCTSTT